MKERETTTKLGKNLHTIDSDFDLWFDSTVVIQETQSDLLTRILGEFKHLFESAWEDGYNHGFSDGEEYILEQDNL